MKRRRGGKKGIIFVISGPSGCGKTTLCNKLLKKFPGMVNSVSMTTRNPRKGERRGRDYIYVSTAEFKKTLEKKGFIEYASVFGNYYGTPKQAVLDTVNRGGDVLLGIDVQGASQIRKIFKGAVLIFILPPNTSELQNRLQKRSTDSPAQIARRLKIAKKEMRAAKKYDYAVVNDRIEGAVSALAAIVRAERSGVGNRYAETG